MSEPQSPAEAMPQVSIMSLKQVEAQLRRMTKVFMDSADPIIIRDMQGRILDVNREVERVFGWTREELVGKQPKEFLPQEWHHLADEMLHRCQAGESVRNIEGVVRAKSNALIPVLTTAFLLTDENNEPVAIAGITKDR